MKHFVKIFQRKRLSSDFFLSLVFDVEEPAVLKEAVCFNGSSFE